MRSSIIFVSVLALFCACKKKKVDQTKRVVVIEKRESEHIREVKLHNDRPVEISSSKEVLKVEQKDGTSIDVIGKGTRWISYTETTDGYTLVRNDQKIYEYAISNDNGDLVPSGVKARNEGHRSKYELKFLENHARYLRYTGKKLKELTERKENSEK